jgi:probable phosphoglycerate mutase
MNHDTAGATRILLIRHGETAWNAERRLQGHLDIPLNAEGRRQAAMLGAALAAEPIDLIVSSDLQRALQTAEAVAAPRSMAVVQDRLLRERCYGGFEGLLYSEIEARFPDAFAAWQARDVDAALPPGRNPGESFRQFYARATGAILALGAANPGKTVAIVCHGGVLECAYRLARRLALETPRDFKVYNASVNRFDFHTDAEGNGAGRLDVRSWGEVDHLRPAVLDDV